jgi:hypothetical protein
MAKHNEDQIGEYAFTLSQAIEILRSNPTGINKDACTPFIVLGDRYICAYLAPLRKRVMICDNTPEVIDILSKHRFCENIIHGAVSKGKHFLQYLHTIGSSDKIQFISENHFDCRSDAITIVKAQYCDHCDYSCMQKYLLKRHIKSVHLKQKDFHCDQCDYSCSQKGNLNNHIKAVHLKQKDFHCDHCDYSCSQKGALNKHIKAVHLNPKPKNMSRGEKKVFDVLENLGLEYKVDFTQEKSFSDLKGYNDGYLRYDFCINLNADEEDYLLIEFDGSQHFKKVKWQSNWTDEKVDENFKLTKRHDRIKNKYARVHDYPLLRIKYNDKDVFEKVKEFIADYSNGQFF